jgi:hypothetical protein
MGVMATDAKVERFEGLLNEPFDFARLYADLQLETE